MGELNSIIYDYFEFQLNDGQSNYDVKTSIAELFDNIKVAKSVVIKADRTITFRFNNVNYPLVELVISTSKHESPYQSPKGFLDIVNIFISNTSGGTVTISIMLV